MSKPEATYTVRSLILTAVISVIATVLVLELSGKIVHSQDKDQVPVGDFKAVHVAPGEDFRMSSRLSGLHAVCQNGYLAIAADADPNYRGILVDYRNRGVRCQPAPGAARTGDAGE